MFISFIGFSFLLHLTVIFSATVYNYFTNRQHKSLLQTYGKQGGWFSSEALNIAISYAIVTVVGAYIFFALFIVMRFAASHGADEVQVVLAKSLFALFIAAMATVVVSEFFFVTVGVGMVALILVALSNSITSMITQPVFRFAGSAAAMILSALTTVRAVAFLVVAGTLFAFPAMAEAQILEPGFESEVVATGLALPTATAFTPDGRVFVAEKNGAIKVVKNGTLLPTPLMTLTDINTFGDRGLIGMALDPNFENNGYLYLSYTYENTPGINIAGPKTARIVRVTVVGDQASESTKVVLVGTIGGNAATPSCEDFAVTADCIASDSNSHSAGALVFGTDGKLYASTGDGADFASVDSRALRSQNIDSLAGKVLRINTDGTAPTDNPFYNGDVNANRSKVYAFGFRNMFRLNFNPDTGRLYGSDVGWSDWEEVNDVVAGDNYGWPCYEGNDPQPQYSCTASSAVTDPLYTYPHNAQGAGSIVVGSFPENSAYPAQYDDSLFIGDYAQMWLKRLVIDDTTGAVQSIHDFQNGVFPVELRTGIDGNVYYIDIVAGELRRLTHTSGNRRPVITMDATPSSGLSPLTVNFSSAGTYDPDGDAFGTVWNFDDGSFSIAANPTHTFTADGVYDVTLTVADSNGASVIESLPVVVGDQAPVAAITSPTTGSFYTELQNVMVMGDATDPEDGVLPASAFDWTVILHHNVHTHTVQQFADTKMITFVADDHNDPDVYMEIILTVTDSAGLTDTTSINMYLNQATTAGNIIANPSLEDPDPALPGQPEGWTNGWYGTMAPLFEYPVNGLSGQDAARVTVSGHVTGEARWFFSPVFIEAGETYLHTHVYTANATSAVTIQYARPDGSYFYEFLGMVPPAADPTTLSYDIDVPAGMQTMTIFHSLFGNGVLTVDEYYLEKQGATTTDTNPPTGSITNITDGQVVSGNVTLDITATDAEGPVTMVHLYVDGSRVQGPEDMTVPFNLDWDTTQFTNGAHTIQVHMHDVPDNHGLSAPITVIVNNTTGTTSTNTQNMIVNGDFESLDGGGNPQSWTAGGWGSHERTLTIVPGPSGNAARTEITAYELSDTGDAKWRHDHVVVVPGTEYVFTTDYRSDTISDVIAQYQLTDGSYFYQGLIKEVQPNTAWTTITGTTIAPANAVSVSAFHLISAVGYVEIDNVSMVASSTGNTSETNVPYIQWESHVDGEEVSGVVTFRASSSDDTGVVGVYFGLNGTFTGSEDFVAPYELTVDTTTYPDGTYILKATSHDQYGNNDVHEIDIIFNNSGTTTGTTTPPSGNNLVTNGDFETLDSAGDPVGWREGGYGVNDTIYTVSTTTGNNVAYVEIYNYVSGDAKWVFDDVDVVPGETYTYSVDYASRNNNEVVAFYRLDDGTTYRAELLGYGPAYDSNDPTDLTTYTVDLTIPVDAEAVSVFYTPLVIDVNQPSYSYIDNVSLTGTVPATTTPPATGANLVANGDLESGAGGTPDAWLEGGWGTNDRALTYPVPGETGSAIRTEITSHTSGDAKWYFADVPVVAGEEYTFSNDYQSDVTTDVLARYSLDDSSFQYVYLGALPAAASWTPNNFTFTAPTNAQSLTVFHAIATVGYLDIDNVSVVGTAGTTTSQVDTADPVVDFATLADNDILSGIVTVDVTATDDTAVSLVNLLLDGSTVATDLTAPYELSLDTTVLTDGTYLLRADAEDAAGNVGQSDEVTIIVDNSTSTGTSTSTNLITNGDIESGAAGVPDNWFQGGWGTNDRALTHPIPGVTGDALRTEITSFTSGDAKWYFGDVSVNPNTSYTFSTDYQSDIDSDILARYTLDDSSFQYVYLGNEAAAGTWNTASHSLTTPTNAQSLTIFHTISAVGYLEIDNVSLIED